MIEIIAIDTPSLGDRGYLATDGSSRPGRRCAARLRPGPGRRRRTRRHDHARVRDAHPQRLRHRRPRAGRSSGRAVPRQRRRPGLVQADRRSPTATWSRSVKCGSGRSPRRATRSRTCPTCWPTAIRSVAAFTGGSLLNGTTGRTDLLGGEHKRALASAQFGSAHRLASELPDAASILPTHGFGSFCSATPSSGGSSTIGDEKRINPALTKNEAEYVEELIAGLDVYPAYYAHMGPANLAGPAAPDLSPPRRADSAELRRRIDAGEWVVDLRSRTAFAAGHLRGALNFESGANLATYLGWLIPWGTPLTLIGDSRRGRRRRRSASCAGSASTGSRLLLTARLRCGRPARRCEFATLSRHADVRRHAGGS